MRIIFIFLLLGMLSCAPKLNSYPKYRAFMHVIKNDSLYYYGEVSWKTRNDTTFFKIGEIEFNTPCPKYRKFYGGFSYYIKMPNENYFITTYEIIKLKL